MCGITYFFLTKESNEWKAEYPNLLKTKVREVFRNKRYSFAIAIKYTRMNYDENIFCILTWQFESPKLLEFPT